MTDTNTLAPTDAELMQVIREAAFNSTIRRDGSTSLRIARAVLAKWGAPAPASQPVAVASDSAPSLANDPRLCCRSHPHEKQNLHCKLREVTAWLRWHAAAGKTPSAESMRAHAEQVDAVALEMRALPAGMDPVVWRWETHNGHAYSNSHADGEGGEPLYAASQVQAMLAAAPSGPAREPLTDEQMHKEFVALRERLFDARVGRACGSCEGGTYRADHNGYSQFHRCSECFHVPMWGEDGREFGAPTAPKGCAP